MISKQSIDQLERGGELWDLIDWPDSRKPYGIEYYYRHTDGQMFDTKVINLSIARRKRDSWLHNRFRYSLVRYETIPQRDMIILLPNRPWWLCKTIKDRLEAGPKQFGTWWEIKEGNAEETGYI